MINVVYQDFEQTTFELKGTSIAARGEVFDGITIASKDPPTLLRCNEPAIRPDLRKLKTRSKKEVAQSALLHAIAEDDIRAAQAILSRGASLDEQTQGILGSFGSKEMRRALYEVVGKSAKDAALEAAIPGQPWKQIPALPSHVQGRYGSNNCRLGFIELHGTYDVTELPRSPREEHPFVRLYESGNRYMLVGKDEYKRVIEHHPKQGFRNIVATFGSGETVTGSGSSSSAIIEYCP